MLKTTLFIILTISLTGCAMGPPMEVSPQVTNSTEISQALQFKSIPDRANVYIKMKAGNYLLLVDGRKQGVLKGGEYWEPEEGEYLNFSVSPGLVNFRFKRPFKYEEDYEHLRHLILADFDLDFTANSVVLIECEASENTDISFSLEATYKRPPGDALRKFEYCPEGANVTLNQGTKACAIPYVEKNYSIEMTSEGWRAMTMPEGQCFLVSDTGKFTKAKLVESERQHINSLDYELAKATKLNTVAAFEAVLAMYPETSRKPEIEKKIKNARSIETQLARRQQIEDRLKRDSHLPLQVQKDKYMLTLKDLLTRQEFEESLFYFELLDTMNAQLSSAVIFFWGEALVRTGRPKLALEKLYSYIEKEGNKGQFYERALILSSEAEALL